MEKKPPRHLCFKSKGGHRPKPCHDSLFYNEARHEPTNKKKYQEARVARQRKKTSLFHLLFSSSSRPSEEDVIVVGKHIDGIIILIKLAKHHALMRVQLD